MSELLDRQALQLAADQCVKCGACLPHCPTYALRPEEPESPRGRITLLQGLATGQLELTQRTEEHLGNCLNCGRCEQVCPANVSYTRLIDNSRFRFDTTPKKHLARRRMFARLMTSHTALRVLVVLARITRAVRLQKILPASAGVKRSLAWLPDNPGKSRQRTVRPPSTTTQRALLFTGCLPDSFESDIILSALAVSRALGLELVRTPVGLCCGALSQHIGDLRAVRNRNRINIDALTGRDGLPITSLLSGCGKGLFETLGFSTDPRAAALRARFTGLNALLIEAASSVDLRPVFTRATAPVAIYHPCTASNKHDTMELARLLPDADIIELGGGYGCCGASGDHMQRNPVAAAQLAAPICDEIEAQSVATVLIENTGCSWHLRASLAERAAKVRILHPLQWLARHLV